MDKEHIIREIQRTTKENGGVPLGKLRFFNETSIKESDWLGRYWARWGDAVREAGFSPNKLQEGYDELILLDKYISLVRELGRLPVPGDQLLKTRKDPGFPSESTFRNRFGSKSALVARLLQYCQDRPEHKDIVQLCNGYSPLKGSIVNEPESGETKLGFVYLLKHGSRREFKIGKTFNPIRREGEISLELPEKLEPIHYIKTDDPSGIENYWHRRFADKRKNSEWFALTPQDVRAFKKWKRIY